MLEVSIPLCIEERHPSLSRTLSLRDWICLGSELRAIIKIYVGNQTPLKLANVKKSFPYWNWHIVSAICFILHKLKKWQKGWTWFVHCTSSLATHNKMILPLRPDLFHPNRTSYGAEILRECWPPTTCPMSHVTCHVSHAMCHVSHITYHMAHIMCQLWLFKELALRRCPSIYICSCLGTC